MKIAVTLELNLDEFCAVKTALELYIQGQTDVRDDERSGSEWSVELQNELQAAETVLRGLKATRLG